MVRKHTLNKSSTGVATPDYEPSSPSTPSVAAIPQAVVPQQQQQQNPKVVLSLSLYKVTGSLSVYLSVCLYRRILPTAELYW